MADEKAQRREIQEKLNKQYIDMKINPIVEPMAIALFQSNVKNRTQAIEFMLNYIKANCGNRPSVNEGEKMELEFLRKELARLSSIQQVGSGGKSTASEKDESSDSECEEVAELPVAMNNAPTVGPRKSVSAEVFGKFHMQKEFVAPVHPKSPEEIEALKITLSKNLIFSTLNPKDKKSILDAIKPVKMKAGETIIKQGDEGDQFYLVETGVLDCTKFINPEDKEETFLKEYKPGESFGELALLYNAPRAATIKCKSDTADLWALDRETYNAIIKTAMQKKREKYDDFLEKVEILKMMEKYERTKLADAFKEEWYEKDDYIIKQGDSEATCFYMIIEGNCVATKTLEPGKPAQKVKDYSPGDYFGERSLIKDEPRAANIIAQSQVCVVSLDRAAFKRLMGPIEEILSRNEAEYNKFV